MAPVIKAATHGRTLYLSRGAWLKVRHGALGLTGERIPGGGDSFVDASLSEVPLYLKLGFLVPMIDPPLHTGAEVRDEFRLIGFTESSAECVIRLDDGERKYSSWEEYPKIICLVSKVEGSWDVELSFEGTAPRQVSINLELRSPEDKKSTLSLKS